MPAQKKHAPKRPAPKQPKPRATKRERNSGLESSGIREGAREYVAAPPRFIDLFCGIGGFRLAFERAGGRCVFSSDYDKFSQQTYEANFGERPHGDIHSVAVADIPAHDILCGGFPCQPFSIAGVSKKLSLGRKHGFEDVSRATFSSPSPTSSISTAPPRSSWRTSRTSRATTAARPSR